jgi:hypothetical protein
MAPSRRHCPECKGDVRAMREEAQEEAESSKAPMRPRDALAKLHKTARAMALRGGLHVVYLVQARGSKTPKFCGKAGRSVGLCSPWCPLAAYWVSPGRLLLVVRSAYVPQ